MQDTRITKDRVRNHFSYGWWKYLLLAVAAVFGWNLFFTSTAYRAPKDKRLDVYFVTYSVPSEETDWLRGEMLNRFPQLEDGNVVSIVYTEEDSYYGTIQLTTYMGAGEGDIYILTKERFDAFKSGGVFVALDDAIADGTLDLRGIDPARGEATTEEGAHGVFGIPADSLYGFMDHSVDNRDLMICVTAYSQNAQTAVAFVDWLVGEMQGEKPDWLVEQERKQPATAADQQISEIPSY